MGSTSVCFAHTPFCVLSGEGLSGQGGKGQQEAKNKLSWVNLFPPTKKSCRKHAAWQPGSLALLTSLTKATEMQSGAQF